MSAADRGWRVFPLLPHRNGKCVCGCDNGGKHPQTMGWQREASAVPEEVRHLFGGLSAGGVGLATGQGSGVWVLDLDVKNGVDGIESIAHLGLPETFTVQTPTGGEHRYFRWSDDVEVRNRAGVLPGVDVRGNGGYVVWAGSTAPAGVYRITNHAPIAAAPRALLDLVVKHKPAPVSTVPGATRTDRYALTALDAAVSRVGGTAEGGRNDELNRSAYSIGRLVAAGRISSVVASESLKEAGRACGLSAGEASRTVDNAFAAAESDPHWPDPPALRVVGDSGPPPSPVYEEDAGPPRIGFADVLGYRGLGSACEPSPADLRLAVNPGNGQISQGHPHNFRQVVNDYRLDIWWCELHQQAMWGEERIEARHTSALSAWFAAAYGLKIGSAAVGEYLDLRAQRDRRNVISDYLNGLEWDGRQRAEAMLTDLFGVENTPLTAAYSRRWLSGCVARALDPGCKLDTAIVLVGAQGARKSSTLRALVGADWFRDTDLDLDGKDAYMGMRGVWVYEMAEMSGVRRAQMARVKGLLSSQVDTYRPPYGRELVSHPRRTVLVGTENHESFLTDASGSRRWWPVRALRCDPEAAAEYRDQYWAEAVHLYRQGCQWWLSAEEEEARRARAGGYTSEDPWTPALEDWLSLRETATTAAILDGPLGVPLDRQTPRDGHRVADILRRLGWARRFGTDDDGKRCRLWVRDA